MKNLMILIVIVMSSILSLHAQQSAPQIIVTKIEGKGWKYIDKIQGEIGFSLLQRFAIDGKNLYVSEKHRILKINMENEEVTILAGKKNSQITQNGTGQNASFRFVEGIALGEKKDTLYIVDDDFISKLHIKSGKVDELVRGARGNLDVEEMAYHDGFLYYARDLRIDKINLKKKTKQIEFFIRGFSGHTKGLAIYDGDIYVTVTGNPNHAIHKINIKTGASVLFAGKGIGYKDGKGEEAQFRNPDGIILNKGYLYVSDYGNKKIRKINIETKQVTTLNFSVQLAQPLGITATDEGHLYVIDYPNTIRKIVICPTIPRPTAKANQIICMASPNKNSLKATTEPGHTLLWYNEAEGGTELAVDIRLEDGASYYAEAVNKDGCKSKRTKVTVTLIKQSDPKLIDGAKDSSPAINNGSSIPMKTTLGTNKTKSFGIHNHSPEPIENINITSKHQSLKIKSFPQSVPACSISSFVVELNADKAQKFTSPINIQSSALNINFNIEAEVTDTDRKLIIYNVVTANNDGAHDFFLLKNIKYYPNNTVTIFNRWGDKVYETKGYDNIRKKFVGISNINSSYDLITGNYYYSIDLGDGSDILTGFLFFKKTE